MPRRSRRREDYQDRPRRAGFTGGILALIILGAVFVVLLIGLMVGGLVLGCCGLCVGSAALAPTEPIESDEEWDAAPMPPTGRPTEKSPAPPRVPAKPKTLSAPERMPPSKSPTPTGRQPP